MHSAFSKLQFSKQQFKKIERIESLRREWKKSENLYAQSGNANDDARLLCTQTRISPFATFYQSNL